MTNYDIYSFGMVSSSTLYSIEGGFPAAEGYAEIDNVHHMTGGEATNSSIVLSRLGVQVKLDGNWIGADENGRRTKQLLDSYRIDSSRLPLKDGYTGVREVVFAAGGTRTIFGTYGRLLEDANWNMPRAEDVNEAKVICLDPFFGDASVRAAELGVDAGIPVVTVDCLHDDPIIRHVSAVVVSESYIQWKYPEGQLEDLFQSYQQSTNGLVIFTFGDRGIWYGRPGEAPRIARPYSIKPVDTAGAGDSFRAGIVYGFLREWSDRKMIDFAAAVAAIVCTRTPGVLHAPDYGEVMDFIRKNQV